MVFQIPFPTILMKEQYRMQITLLNSKDEFSLPAKETNQSYGYGYLKHSKIVLQFTTICLIEKLYYKIQQHKGHPVCVICKHFLHHFNLETIEYLLCIVYLVHNTP